MSPTVVASVLTGLVVLHASSGCARSEASPRGPSQAVPASSGDAAGAVVRAARGVIKAIDAAGKFVNIKHDVIPGYMPPMTMPFDVEHKSLLEGLKPGDAVRFTFHEQDDRLVLDSIEHLAAEGG